MRSGSDSGRGFRGHRVARRPLCRGHPACESSGGRRPRAPIPHRAHARTRSPRNELAAGTDAEGRGPASGSVHSADGRRRGDDSPTARYRRLHRVTARPDRSRQGDRDPGSPVQRQVRLRRRRRMGDRGAAQPRSPQRSPLDGGRGTDPGDPRDLDPRRGRVSWQVRQLRSHLVLAQARPAAAPARPDRQQRSAPRWSGQSISETAGCRSRRPA